MWSDSNLPLGPLPAPTETRRNHHGRGQADQARERRDHQDRAHVRHPVRHEHERPAEGPEHADRLSFVGNGMGKLTVKNDGADNPVPVIAPWQDGGSPAEVSEQLADGETIVLVCGPDLRWRILGRWGA